MLWLGAELGQSISISSRQCWSFVGLLTPPTRQGQAENQVGSFNQAETGLAKNYQQELRIGVNSFGVMRKRFNDYSSSTERLLSSMCRFGCVSPEKSLPEMMLRKEPNNSFYPLNAALRHAFLSLTTENQLLSFTAHLKFLLTSTTLQAPASSSSFIGSAFPPLVVRTFAVRAGFGTRFSRAPDSCRCC